MTTKVLDECVVEYSEEENHVRKVYNTLVAWYFKHNMFAGECVMQDDNCQIDAINLLSNLADNIFTEHYEE